MMAGTAIAGDLPTVDSHRWTNKYDQYFRKYSKRYFGAHFDWQWFKAQAIAESHLKPDATSHVGAQGLMQIMPATFNDIQRSNPHFESLDEPRWNIAAGIFYDRMLFRKWQNNIPEQERLMLTFASYNAGLGNIRRAYRQTPEPVTKWDDVAPRAPGETRGYVKRIRKLKSLEGKLLSKSGKRIASLLASSRTNNEDPAPN